MLCCPFQALSVIAESGFTTASKISIQFSFQADFTSNVDNEVTFKSALKTSLATEIGVLESQIQDLSIAEGIKGTSISGNCTPDNDRN